MKKKVEQAQKFLKEMGLDGWLLYDFHQNNELACRFLNIQSHTTRRFFYWIPVQGEPTKIVHSIESHVLDHCPGLKKTYLSWQSIESQVRKILKEAGRIAMEYSPKNAVPDISRVDAGTIDLIRSFGVEVVSSGDFLPYFTAVMSESNVESHLRAAKTLDRIAAEIWRWIADNWEKGISEYDIQQKIFTRLRTENLITNPPTVGINAHSSDPHHKPQKEGLAPLKRGDFILIDFWAKEEGGIFADICRVGVIATQPTARQNEIFHIVRKAQKTAVDFIKTRFAQKKRAEGWEVDAAARKVIKDAGYGEFFLHRTGHSIDFNLHGSGAHLDNLEMHDTRPLLPMTCFSIEPAIYLSGEFGVRLEHDVFIHENGTIEITGGEQDDIVCLG